MSTNITRKWVKRANMWALIIPEFDKKTNKMKNKITWWDEMPALVDDGEMHGASPASRAEKAAKAK